MAYGKPGGSAQRRPRPEGGAQRRPRRRKFCHFCVNKDSADYKDIIKLKKFVTDRGKILPRRATGVCAKHQRSLVISIKRARHIGLLPFCVE